MQKIVIILLIIIYLTGCSVSKYGVQSNTDGKEDDSDIIDLSDILKHNVTLTSFYIRKAEVEILDQGEKQKLIASVKFSEPDSFLISVRTTSGIEAVRILLTKDTILINDRMNKTYLFGSKTAAQKKYGFSALIFPVFFGDVIINENAECVIYRCNNDVANIETFVDGYKIKYAINCNRRKSTEISLIREIDTKTTTIKYDDYKKFDNISVTKRISISEFNNIDIINIRITGIVIPWKGNIKFMPGIKYDQIEIK